MDGPDPPTSPAVVASNVKLFRGSNVAICQITSDSCCLFLILLLACGMKQEEFEAESMGTGWGRDGRSVIITY